MYPTNFQVWNFMSEDKNQLRFIELLLIVGAIIGSLRFNKFTLTFFLISSLAYYYAASNQLGLYRKVFAGLTSILFGVLITYPFLSFCPGYPEFNIIVNYILAICLSILVFINLQEKSEVALVYIITVTILTLMILNWFYSAPPSSAPASSVVPKSIHIDLF